LLGFAVLNWKRNIINAKIICVMTSDLVCLYLDLL
jgi:hypothetical protein